MQLSLSLSQPLYLEPCIQTRLSFHVLCLGRVLWVWQCLIYLSYTLLGHTLGTLAMSDLHFLYLVGHTLWMQAMFIYLSCILLGPRSLGMTMSNLSFLPLVGPYSQNVGNVWLTFLLCVLALCMLYIYIYIYIYIMCVCVCVFKDGHALCMMDSHGYEGTPPVIMGVLDLGVWMCI